MIGDRRSGLRNPRHRPPGLRRRRRECHPALTPEASAPLRRARGTAAGWRNPAGWALARARDTRRTGVRTGARRRTPGSPGTRGPRDAGAACRDRTTRARRPAAAHARAAPCSAGARGGRPPSRRTARPRVPRRRSGGRFRRIRALRRAPRRTARRRPAHARAASTPQRGTAAARPESLSPFCSRTSGDSPSEVSRSSVATSPNGTVTRTLETDRPPATEGWISALTKANSTAESTATSSRTSAGTRSGCPPFNPSVAA